MDISKLYNTEKVYPRIGAYAATKPGSICTAKQTTVYLLLTYNQLTVSSQNTYPFIKLGEQS